MQRIHTHYDTLKVARDAPDEVIRSAYRALARKYHPDSNPDLEEAVREMQALNHAFEVLTDPAQRKAHDEWIDQQTASQSAGASCQPDRSSGTSSAKNQQKEHAGKSPLAGHFWPKADKLTPGAVMLILALAAALIALLVIALAGQSRSPSIKTAPSESTPKPPLTPKPTPTPTPTPRAPLTPPPPPSPSPSSAAYSEAISIDFGHGSAQRSLQPEESAGAFSAANWNNASGASGKIPNLRNSSGDPTSAEATWAANNLYQVQDVSTGGEGGNFTMMFGYLDTTDTSTTEVRVVNIPERFLADGYDLIVYVDGSNGPQHRVGRYQVVVPGSKPVTKFAKDGAGQSFDGKFIEADEAAAPATAADGMQGNTIVFRNIKSREFALLAKGEIGEDFNRAPVNGIQIAKRSNEVDGLPGFARTELADPQAVSKSMCLTELTPMKALLYGDLLVNQYNGYPSARILVDKKPCDRYIFAHAPSRLLYKIPPGFRQFTAVGIKPSGDGNLNSDWIYIVKADGKEIFRSGSLADDPDGQIEVVAALPSGAKTIELIVEDMQSTYADHSIWAYPTLR